MKLLIIRHGDPDYSIDSLTEKGWREAELLAERISKLDVKAFYCSPLGRAKDTASKTLEKMGRECEIKEWLKEFYYCQVKLPYTPYGQTQLCWDFLPSYYTKVDELYSNPDFMNLDYMIEGNMPQLYKAVTDGLDELLEEHGYKRNGRYYEAISRNDDTIVFFCHFGLESFLLGHLLGISPIALAQGTIAAPTSVTTLITEEREEGIAIFRMASFGDISHLYVAGEEPAFAGRFCEQFTDDTRH